MLGSLYAFDFQVPELDTLDSFARLAVMVPAGVLVYLVASWMLNRDGLQSVVSTAREMLRRN